jgi:DNA processing protein
MSSGISAAERLARLRLARSDTIGPVTFRELLQHFPTAAEALEALPSLAQRGGRKGTLRIPSRVEAEREIAATEALGATLIVFGEEMFPHRLAVLDPPPPVISVMGSMHLVEQKAIAIVGSRNASAAGAKLGATLARDLGARGFGVVSGLARGIDAAAHRGALPRRRTVAVIAGGLDVPYPPENADLQRRIAEAGAVVAEAPLGTEPQARHFPRRNRIIAGLVLGIVVVEAAPRSGSLITARLGQEAGREIFAVPGSPLDPRARGPNQLLREGAVLVETAEDVLRELERPRLAMAPAAPERLEEPSPSWDDPALHRKIAPQLLELLSPSPTLVDDLIRQCHVSAAVVGAVLLELEVAGRIQSLPGNRVALVTEDF